jgi:hypothetical protein
MSAFGWGKSGGGVHPGDIFRKLGTYRMEWVVDKIFDYSDIPSHARLTERNGSRTMTVAVTMLLDPDAFVAVGSVAPVGNG